MSKTRALQRVSAEQQRLHEDAARTLNWKRWGPYLAERQWGTVREDYSADGESWRYFGYEEAMSRAYRWGEDGLLGVCDRQCRLAFALALWNERDPFLKERLFGLANHEGNHGEDVKECYFYQDASPTHSYLKALYKYPQAAFPYEQLRSENRRRSRDEPEYELLDTGVFDGNRYFDVTAEYAKHTPDDLLIQITVVNRGPESAPLHLLPTLWYRNTWSWGCTHEGCEVKPKLRQVAPGRVQCDHASLGRYFFEIENDHFGHAPELLFVENETNARLLFGADNATAYVKDGINAYLTQGRADRVNPRKMGTKVAAHFRLTLAAGETRVFRLRLYADTEPTKRSSTAFPFGPAFDALFAQRRAECDEFYQNVPGAHAQPPPDQPHGLLLAAEQENISRQAYAGLLWSKQFYHLVVEDWLRGDPGQPPPPKERLTGRNADWGHVYIRDVISMPDKWEYPWFAAWDLAFHMIPFARIDPHFAKDQLNLLLREWYMHPNGQIPAYEWNFSDVNPPVHAWACWRVYKMSGARGARDREFLARTFQKLLLNFTWWVNRKDPAGNNLFAGGFLGLDNIGVFDRSKPLPSGGTLTQADGTAWMAFYCSTMLAMALELADGSPEYEDIASKFFEHFVAIAEAMNHLGGTGLWHEGDGFYYDRLVVNDETTPVRLRSMVGIIPLFAVEFIDEQRLQHLPGFAKRTRWFLKHRRNIEKTISFLAHDGCNEGRYLLAIPSRERLERVLRYVFDEKEFLSPYGVRSMSRAYREKPFTLKCGGSEFRVDYEPGDSRTWLFGGNSNWRGPVWLPVNYLLIEALERYHHFYGDTFLVEFPTGSGKRVTLLEAARELSRRVTTLFLPNEQGRRPCHGLEPRYVSDPHWSDLVQFHEFFHGDTGEGLGASHQTGWTALVTQLFASDGRPDVKK